MKSYTTPSGNIITLFGTEKECPTARYNELQKYQLLEIGVGSDIEAIGTRFSRLHAFLSSNKVSDATKEAENLYYTHYFILEKINVSSFSFACLVHSIDGIIYDDLSEDGLRAVIAKIDTMGIPQEVIEQMTEDIKKK